MLQGIGSFANAAAIVAAAIAGAQWLRQRRTERQLEVAEQILALTYRVKDVFQTIRSPLTLAGEAAEAEKILDESVDEDFLSPRAKHRQQTAQVINSRLVAANDFWRQTSDLMPLARTYFGADVEEMLRSILRIRQRVWAALITYGMSGELDRETERHFEAEFWAEWGKATSGKDEIAHEIESLILKLEKRVQPLVGLKTARHE